MTSTFTLKVTSSLSLTHRLIRAMSCKFLALSATVGNADELRGWLERVRGDQLVGVECIDVLPEDPPNLPLVPYKFENVGNYSVNVVKTLDNNTILLSGLSPQTTVLELKKRIHAKWTGTSVGKQQLLFGNIDLVNETATLESYGLFSGTDSTDIPTIRMYSLVNVLTHQGRFINLQRYVWSNGALKVKMKYFCKIFCCIYMWNFFILNDFLCSPFLLSYIFYYYIILQCQTLD